MRVEYLIYFVCDDFESWMKGIITVQKLVVGVLTRYSALQLDVLRANSRSSLLFYSLETDPLFLTKIPNSNALADSFFLVSLATIRSAICFKSFFSIELFLQNNLPSTSSTNTHRFFSLSRDAIFVTKLNPAK
jgi:hypothetical protein